MKLTPKQKEGQGIIDRIDKHLEKLCKSKISYTELKYRQKGMYDCKIIVRDHFGLKQEMEIAI